MKHIRIPRLAKSEIILLFLFLAVLALRLVPGLGEVYALRVYPVVSYLLSLLSACVPFSLDEVMVVAMGLLLLAYPFVARWRRVRARLILRRELVFVAWIYVWFYIGWGANYYRTDFYTRTGVKVLRADSLQFRSFLEHYTARLNASYTQKPSPEHSSIIDSVKSLYTSLPAEVGVCRPRSFQQPKRVLFNSLYSAVSVLGYMGPFAGESQLNMQLRPVQYPFTYAHELAHLLGVSSEAEANFWAYCVCRRSSDDFIRYSAYFGLLPYVVRNAKGLLSEVEFNAWIATVRPSILRQWKSQREFWFSQRSEWLDSLQTALYDWFLTSNNVQGGVANYDQVVGMVVSVECSGLEF